MSTSTLTPKALPAHWYQAPCKSLDKGMRDQAFAYQQSLTKPPGSLGQLEAIAVELAAMQGQLKPQINSASISIFAADHGVAAEGVSAFPQAVTAEMVRNFAQGGAAVSVLARHAQAHFEVVNVGTVTELEVLPHVIDARVAAGTANFCQQPAMTSAALAQALQAGAAAAERAQEKGADIFIGGEMGIANTTSATALAATLLTVTAAEIAGAGTGLDEAGIAHKVDVIEQALALHRPDSQQPLPLLQCLGGFEIAGLCGAYIRAAQLGMPVLVDGFISTVAALVATRINPECRVWMLFSHQSHEQGHQTLLTALKAQPLLAIGMRLGEASGAALVIPLIQAACRLHGEMATFAEADVSDKE